ncbi:MAG: hypothetical protein QHC88_16685 [Achromobacter sp.]|uniref:hypothetical protein n=1 Tax=Achromobacter sp. TaxID=134375 RepID=UPI0029B8A3C3|nr:hypothetical protein [Achromobacter sp.]MDX3986886.1 hypothetical protein [Achromobacter sp.]
MTENNAAQPVLTDDEIFAALRPLYADAVAAQMGAGDDLSTARAIESALLSKLRAEGVQAGDAVAYLDLGAGGYMDVGTDLTDEQLAALPKGRHRLAIIGTHGVDGYTRAALASAPVAGELPDAVRVPLDSLHADAGYLVGRVLDHSLSRDEVVAVIRSRIDAAKAALAAPQASEAVRDAVDVALPLLPKGHARNSDVHPDSYAYDKWQLADYARAAILAYRQRGADPVIGHITVKGKGRSSVDLDASHADLPEGEYVLRAALASAPVAGEAHEATKAAYERGRKKGNEEARSWPEDFAHENGRYMCKCHRCDQIFHGHKRRVTCKVCHAAPQASEAVRPALAVWYGSMPESNGKKNWTAILYRKDEGLMGGVNITIDRSEYPDRVRYEADRLRFLIGEIDKEPWILDYDADKCDAPQADKDGGDCAKGVGDVAMRDAAFEAVRMQLCKLPRYSFLSDGYGAVRRVEGKSGSWIGFDAAHALFDPVSVDAAVSPTPAVIKQSLTATQTGEKGESE